MGSKKRLQGDCCWEQQKQHQLHVSGNSSLEGLKESFFKSNTFYSTKIDFETERSKYHAKTVQLFFSKKKKYINISLAKIKRSRNIMNYKESMLNYGINLSTYGILKKRI